LREPFVRVALCNTGLFGEFAAGERPSGVERLVKTEAHPGPHTGGGAEVADHFWPRKL